MNKLNNVLDTFEDNIVDIRKICVQKVLVIQRENAPYKKINIEEKITMDDLWQHVRYLEVEKRTKNYIRTVKRIDSKEKSKKNFYKKSITDEDIERARETLISDLYDGKLSERKNRTGLCPFHDEKTPSFTIFPNNRFKCFGCGAYGSSIDFVMKRDNLDFIKVVKILCNMT